MRDQGGGMIINMSSFGGTYGTSVPGIHIQQRNCNRRLQQALRMEVRKFKDQVIVINPGDFNTNNSANRRKFLSPVIENDPLQGTI
jgi:short-subunit dehydrogenase